MTITSYSQLSSLGKIIYSRYRANSLTITSAQMQRFVVLGRITQDEADFILGI